MCWRVMHRQRIEWKEERVRNRESKEERIGER